MQSAINRVSIENFYKENIVGEVLEFKEKVRVVVDLEGKLSQIIQKGAEEEGLSPSKFFLNWLDNSPEKEEDFVLVDLFCANEKHDLKKLALDFEYLMYDYYPTCRGVKSKVVPVSELTPEDTSMIYSMYVEGAKKSSYTYGVQLKFYY